MTAPGPGAYQPPGYGYQVPPTFGMPAPGAGDPEHDPLVPPPYGGLNPAYDRLVDTLRRSWRPLALIMLITFALPQTVVNLLAAAVGFGIGADMLGGLTLDEAQGLQVAVGAAGIGLLLTVALLFVSAVGWGAGIWAVTQQAVGQPAGVAEALQAGLRRSGPMFGWYLLFVLMVIAGAVACVVPGLYLGVAGSLFSLAVIYERGRGIGRSFGLVHRSFGPAVGRVLLLAACYLMATCAIGVLGLAAGAVVGPLPAGTLGSQVVGTLIEAALTIPLNMVVLVGLLLTYTQLRAREEPLTTGQLWVAASQP